MWIYHVNISSHISPLNPNIGYPTCLPNVWYLIWHFWLTFVRILFDFLRMVFLIKSIVSISIKSLTCFATCLSDFPQNFVRYLRMNIFRSITFRRNNLFYFLSLLWFISLPLPRKSNVGYFSSKSNLRLSTSLINLNVSLTHQIDFQKNSLRL